MNTDLIINFSIAMIAILNPMGIIPIWSELTSDKINPIRVRIAFLTTLTAYVVLLIFLISGETMLNLFQIDLPSFQVAGGILLFLTGLDMIQGTATRLQKQEEEVNGPLLFIAKQRFRKIIVPLAVPLLAGPGSITTVLIYGNKAGNLFTYLGLSAVLLGALALLWGFFSMSNYLERKLDRTVFTVFTRIFGVIITAIAVQFILEALTEVFPVLIQGGTRLDIDNL